MDEEEEEEESVNEEILVPKVRVAEDGSIILDEERCCDFLIICIFIICINILFLKPYQPIVFQFDSESSTALEPQSDRVVLCSV